MRNEGAYQQLLAPLATSRSGLMMLFAGDLGELTEKQQEYLQHILELNEYMISLVGGWADIERLSKGQVTLEVESCNIGAVIKTVASEDVELHRTSQWPMVLADPLRLKQMITNILESFDNVEVRARINENFCIITFHDRNKSTVRHRAAVLEALHTNTSTAQLGLRVALLLAEAHGGSLELNPHAAEGTKLHLKLPLARQLNLL